MPTKTILCLANSYKQGGRCVAGIEIRDGQPLGWIRPVPDRAGHAVSLAEQNVRGHGDALVGDVINLGVTRHAPMGHQTENWILDPKVAWTRTSAWSYDDLLPITQNLPGLWLTGHSTRAGINDQVPADRLPEFSRSIALIEPSELRIVVTLNDRSSEAEARAHFRYRGDDYAFRVTDPRYRGPFQGAGTGTWTIQEALLTVSLAEPWQRPGADRAYAYKVAAAIIEPEEMTRPIARRLESHPAGPEGVKSWPVEPPF